MKIILTLLISLVTSQSLGAVYKVGAYEVDGVDLDYVQEIPLSVENINTTSSIYGQSNLTQILEYLRIFSLYATSTTSVNTTSTTFSALSGMSISPTAGTYILFFSGDVSTSGVNTQAQVTLYKNSTAIPEALRTWRSTTDILGLITLSTNNSQGSMTTMAKVTANGSDVFTAQYRHVSGGSVTVNARSLLMIKVVQ